MVRVAELAVVGEPGEDFGQIFGQQPVEPAPVDQLAQDQAVVVEDVSEHVRLRGRVAPVQVAEAVEDIADTADDGANPDLFGIGLALKKVLQRVPLLLQRVDPGQEVAVLLAPGTGVTGM